MTKLAQYHARRTAERVDRVTATLAAMTPREQRLVREAAVTQYAVDMSRLSIERHEPDDWFREPWFTVRANAVWYRRRKGVTVACIGTLRTSRDTMPVDVRQFLEQYTDGRYGGDCHGRWDRSGYWGNVPLATQEQHLEILRPILDNFPTSSPGTTDGGGSDGHPHVPAGRQVRPVGLPSTSPTSPAATSPCSPRTAPTGTR